MFDANKFKVIPAEKFEAMTTEELRDYARALVEQITESQAHTLLTGLIKKEVLTLTTTERTELLNNLREIKKGSVKHE